MKATKRIIKNIVFELKINRILLIVKRKKLLRVLNAYSVSVLKFLAFCLIPRGYVSIIPCDSAPPAYM